MLEKQRGRKAIILLTDGEDTGSKLSMAESITSAQRADALAYAVRIADDESAFNRGFGGPGMGGRHGGGMGRPSAQSRPDGKKILRQISQETGGGYFEVSKKKTVQEIYQEIEDELRSQYSIGYTPKQSSGGNQFRTIRLTVKQKGLVVQSRSGYYPGGGAE